MRITIATPTYALRPEDTGINRPIFMVTEIDEDIDTVELRADFYNAETEREDSESLTVLMDFDEDVHTLHADGTVTDDDDMAWDCLATALEWHEHESYDWWPPDEDEELADSESPDDDEPADTESESTESAGSEDEDDDEDWLRDEQYIIPMVDPELGPGERYREGNTIYVSREEAWGSDDDEDDD